jgi:hypothetical protein
MSDQAKKDEQDPKTTEDPEEDVGADKAEAKSTDYKAEAEKWKALARKHEAQAKANAQAAQKLAEIEDADKSEAQKLADKVARGEKELADTKLEMSRLRVAMRKGLTEAQAKRLIGDNEDDLEKDADELLQTFAPKSDNGDKGDKPASRPRERMRSGSAPDEEPDETDPAKLAASLPRL